MFLGYGIHDHRYSDYKGVDVKDKVLLVYDGEPKKKGISYVTGQEGNSEWSTNWRLRLKAAKKKGAKAIFIVSSNAEETLASESMKEYMMKENMTLGNAPAENEYCSNIYITEKMMEELVGACLLYTSPSPRDSMTSRMPSSA